MNSATSIPSPVLTTTLTRYLKLIDSLQHHGRCAGFELTAIECYESYGYKSTKCEDYMHDFRECLFGLKRSIRVVAMKNERLLQYKEGTREELYAPAPPDDAY